jgi:hypothetical protein
MGAEQAGVMGAEQAGVMGAERPGVHARGRYRAVVVRGASAPERRRGPLKVLFRPADRR